MTKILKNLEMVYQKAINKLSQINFDEEIINFSDREKVKQLFKDFKLHEIELEMQNWELLSASNELERINKYYQDFYENSPVSLVRINTKGLILTMNNTFSNSTMPKKIEVNKTNIYSLIEERADSDKLHISINKLIEMKKNQIFDLNINTHHYLATISLEANNDTEETNINLFLMAYQ